MKAPRELLHWNAKTQFKNFYGSYLHAALSSAEISAHKLLRASKWGGPLHGAPPSSRSGELTTRMGELPSLPRKIYLREKWDLTLMKGLSLGHRFFIKRAVNLSTSKTEHKMWLSVHTGTRRASGIHLCFLLLLLILYNLFRKLKGEVFFLS